MGERRGTKGLELWCRKMTEGYPGVKIDNMTTSWRDGLAFCAIIHHFRPDLIDFSKLNKNDIYHNNELAFRVAEQYLGIPALLEPEDMVEFPVPDRLSILTYLSQFYQAFAVTQGSAATRIPAKRPQTTTDHGIVSPASTSPPTKPTAESCVGVEKSMRKLLLKELKSIAYHGTGSKVRREPCAKCGLPVFIAERLNVGKLLYHRTCFRCARCDSQLNLANYYETENNEFCCEMCPDEEKARVTADPLEKSVLARSMSDEEKSALNQLKCSNQEDEYSSQFESALENPSDSSLKRNFTLTTEQSSEYSMARSRFFESQIGDSASDNDEPPDLPKSKPPTVDNSNENSIVSNNSAYDSGFPTTKLDSSVNSVSDNVNIGSKFVEDEKIVTKDIDKEITHSTVKSRVRLFENNIKSEDVNKDVPVPLELPQDSQIHSSLEYDRSKHSDRDNILNSDVSVTNVLGENVDLTTNILGDNINLTSYIENDTQKVDPIDDSITDEIEFMDDDEHSLKTANDYKDTDLKSITENSDLIDDGNVSISSKCNEEIKDSNSKISAETVNVSDSNVMHTSMNLKNSELPQNELKGAADDIDIIIDTKVDINKESNQIVIFPEESETTQEDQLPPVVPLPRKHKKKVKKQTSYPEDLNPFGDDLETSINPDMSLNPFGDDDEEEEELSRPIPSPRLRRKMDTAETVNSTLRNPNPFEDEEEEKDQKIETKPPLPTNRKKLIEVPKISLNPFGSDDEDEEDAGNVKIPVPTPRNSSRVPEPKPRYESGTTATSSSAGGSHSSLSSGNSAGQTNTFRKKKLAPKPPSSVISDATESGHSSLTSSPSQSVAPSPSVTPKYRKAKKAPPPPSSSTPVSNITETNNYLSTSTSVSPLPSKTAENVEEDFDKEKSAKDEMNRNRQSQNLNIQSPTSSETSSSICTPNKSTYGKWKRRKGQAPQRPIPQRRSIKALPMAEIRRELEIIEIQQQGLEKQGVMIEQIIRERSENNTNPDEPLSVELEDMILQLFELVNEKNELFRKQAELMYLRRQQRLEEEHADVEYQIRCLMLQPEANKTDSDKEREEELINRLVEIVERRNEIIECLEMDRVREAQEDDSINNQMNLYTSKREEEKTPTEKPKKEKKKHKITKEKLKEKFHFRKEKEKDHKVDVDKDIDESETPTEKDKEKKKKKKLNIF